MQSVRERPSDPWIGMIGWVGSGAELGCVDCGLWMAGGWSRLLGAAVIVGLKRVKPVVVVSQRTSLLFLLLFCFLSLSSAGKNLLLSKSSTVSTV